MRDHINIAMAGEYGQFAIFDDDKKTTASGAAAGEVAMEGG